jgi:hypothetical protein
MGDRKIDLQDTPAADLAGVECDPNRFSVAGRTGSHHPIMRRLLLCARIARNDATHAIDVLEAL